MKSASINFKEFRVSFRKLYSSCIPHLDITYDSALLVFMIAFKDF